MTCSEYQNHLSGYMDGELSRWTRWKVANHLRCCGECSCVLRELSEVDSGLLGVLREESSPEYVTSAIMRRLPAMPPATRVAQRLRLAWTAGAVGALTLAGMQLLALAGAYTLGFQSGQQGAKRTSLFGPAAPVSTPVEPVTHTGSSGAGRPTGSVWIRQYPGGSAAAPAPELHKPPVQERRATPKRPVFSHPRQPAAQY